MTRRPDETTEAYHARLAAGAKPPSFLKRVNAILRDDAVRHDITDTQFMLAENTGAARPVLPVETPAEGLREALLVKGLRDAQAHINEAYDIAREAKDHGACHFHALASDAISDLLDDPLNSVAGFIIHDGGKQDEQPAAPAPAPLSGRDGSLREADLEAWVFHMLVGHDELMALHSNSEDRFDEQRDTARGIVAEIRRRAALAAVPPETEGGK